jgi:outer membrane lipoprotein-sorting protein
LNRHISREIDEGEKSMQRKIGFFFFMLLLLTSMVGCGGKDAKEVVKDLSERSQELASYTSHGKMIIHTGQEPLEYDVEVWYKKPHYYRVALKNVKKDVVQILLRNDEGVFVLTPHLKKSFRFQSDWPKTSGQVYLYQTLLASIVEDQTRQFQVDGKVYQFEVAAKYTLNQNLTKQRIWLDHDLHPRKVDVMNADNEVMVKMEFDRFKEDASFDKDAFDMQRNLNSLPNAAAQTIVKADAVKAKEQIKAVAPGYIPEGTRLVDEQTIQTLNGPIVVMRYQGQKLFTFIQKRPSEIAASLSMFGEPVELEHTVGVVIGADPYRRLTWTYDGTEFELVGNLSTEEMKQVANSVFDQSTK